MVIDKGMILQILCDISKLVTYYVIFILIT